MNSEILKSKQSAGDVLYFLPPAVCQDRRIVAYHLRKLAPPIIQDYILSFEAFKQQLFVISRWTDDGKDRALNIISIHRSLNEARAIQEQKQEKVSESSNNTHTESESSVETCLELSSHTTRVIRSASQSSIYVYAILCCVSGYVDGEPREDDKPFVATKLFAVSQNAAVKVEKEINECIISCIEDGLFEERNRISAIRLFRTDDWRMSPVYGSSSLWEGGPEPDLEDVPAQYLNENDFAYVWARTNQFAGKIDLTRVRTVSNGFFAGTEEKEYSVWAEQHIVN